MTMTPSQALRAPRPLDGPGERSLLTGTTYERPSVSDPHSWGRMGRRLALASITSLVALGTRPVEALGGIDGIAEDDAPVGDPPDRPAATAA